MVMTSPSTAAVMASAMLDDGHPETHTVHVSAAQTFATQSFERQSPLASQAAPFASRQRVPAGVPL